MDKKTIYYIATKLEVVSRLKAYFQAQGFDFVEYPLQALPEVNVLLIVEPISINTGLYAISNIWKDWLLTQAPYAKLLVACHHKTKHPNVLNLLDLPSSFESWFNKTSTVKDFVAASNKSLKSDKSEESWSSKMPARGYDILQVLERFYKGHDFSKNVSKQIDALINLIKEYEIKDVGAHESGQIIANSWMSLSKRFKYYGPLFQNTPYTKEFERVGNEVAELDRFVQKFTKSLGDYPTSRKLLKTYMPQSKIEILGHLIKDTISLHEIKGVDFQ
jgi:hypothetical protein